jgi:hypothetical protein
MSDMSDMLQLQNELQIEAYGGEAPNDLDPDSKLEFIRWNVLALEDELHEALQECGWKPWAKTNHLNTDAFQSELVDAFHFFMNLMLVTGMTAEDLITGYRAKRQKNIIRQQDGYDGVSTKCVSCWRALDDDAVMCYELAASTEVEGERPVIEWYCRLNSTTGTYVR